MSNLANKKERIYQKSMNKCLSIITELTVKVGMNKKPEICCNAERRDIENKERKDRMEKQQQTEDCSM